MFKRKRLTIPPEQVLRALHLLLARPDEESGSNKLSASERKAITEVSSAEWTWDRMQAEKASGYKIASHFAAFDQLNDATIVDRFRPLKFFESFQQSPKADGCMSKGSVEIWVTVHPFSR